MLNGGMLDNEGTSCPKTGYEMRILRWMSTNRLKIV